MTYITRYRETGASDSTVRCRLWLGDRMTLQEFYDELRNTELVNSPEDIEVFVQWIQWIEPSTDEERLSWIHVQALQENSHRDFIKRRYHELFGGSND